MKQICVRWENTINHQDSGAVTMSLPVSIGQDPRNDVVLAMPATGVAERHAVLDGSRETLLLRDVRNKPVWIGGEQKVDPKRPFYIGLYRLSFEIN